MSASPEKDRDLAERQPAGIGRAVTAESLYLANLLVAPGIAFLVLGVLFLRRGKDTPPLAAAHIEQTVSASIWAGVLLVLVNGAILALGGYRGLPAWTFVILYFTVCHSTLVLLGVMGLVKAMAGQCWRFPLVGRPLPSGCPDATRHG